MSKYKFDMRIGHYIINEDANTESTQNDTTNLDQQQNNTVALKNLNTTEILQLKKDKETKLADMDNQLVKKNDIVLQIQDKIAKMQDSQDLQQSALDNLQAQLIQAQYDVEMLKFNKAKADNEATLKILAAQKKLLESMRIKRHLPEKYSMLNESNIQNAKIHINKLIDNDEQQRIKGMIDFKKIFGKSQLLYGKDKLGYYAVCVDQEDFNKLTNTLEEVGFLRSHIIDTIMPQLFNRQELIK